MIDGDSSLKYQFSFLEIQSDLYAVLRIGDLPPLTHLSCFRS